MTPLATVEHALNELRSAKMVILVDDGDRHNAGRLCLAAQAVTPEAVNFMARFGRGLICLALDGATCDRLKLPPMVRDESSPHGAFTVSIEARKGVSTGISAADRAHTMLTAIAPGAVPEELARPGHVFPLRARDGGVLTRTGEAEGAVDLARLAGLAPAAVLCQIMNEDGTVARLPQLKEFSLKHGLRICSIADLVAYRLEHEHLVRRAADVRLPTCFGEFRAIVFENDLNGKEHLALVMGEIDDNEPVLVRVHAECVTGDVFGSHRCACAGRLHGALEAIAAAGRGVLLYLRREERGRGVAETLKGYAQRDPETEGSGEGHRAVRTDARDYGVGAQILAELGVKRIRLLTDHPRNLVGLKGYGMEVVETVGVGTQATKEHGSDGRAQTEAAGAGTGQGETLEPHARERHQAGG